MGRRNKKGKNKRVKDTGAVAKPTPVAAIAETPPHDIEISDPNQLRKLAKGNVEVPAVSPDEDLEELNQAIAQITISLKLINTIASTSPQDKRLANLYEKVASNLGILNTTVQNYSLRIFLGEIDGGEESQAKYLNIANKALDAFALVFEDPYFSFRLYRTVADFNTTRDYIGNVRSAASSLFSADPPLSEGECLAIRVRQLRFEEEVLGLMRTVAEAYTPPFFSIINHENDNARSNIALQFDNDEAVTKAYQEKYGHLHTLAIHEYAGESWMEKHKNFVELRWALEALQSMKAIHKEAFDKYWAGPADQQSAEKDLAFLRELNSLLKYYCDFLRHYDQAKVVDRKYSESDLKPEEVRFLQNFLSSIAGPAQVFGSELRRKHKESDVVASIHECQVVTVHHARAINTQLFYLYVKHWSQNADKDKAIEQSWAYLCAVYENCKSDPNAVYSFDDCRQLLEGYESFVKLIEGHEDSLPEGAMELLPEIRDAFLGVAIILRDSGEERLEELRPIIDRIRPASAPLIEEYQRIRAYINDDGAELTDTIQADIKAVIADLSRRLSHENQHWKTTEPFPEKPTPDLRDMLAIATKLMGCYQDKKYSGHKKWITKTIDEAFSCFEIFYEDKDLLAQHLSDPNFTRAGCDLHHILRDLLVSCRNSFPEKQGEYDLQLLRVNSHFAMAASKALRDNSKRGASKEVKAVKELRTPMLIAVHDAVTYLKRNSATGISKLDRATAFEMLSTYARNVSSDLSYELDGKKSRQGTEECLEKLERVWWCISTLRDQFKGIDIQNLSEQEKYELYDNAITVNEVCNVFLEAFLKLHGQMPEDTRKEHVETFFNKEMLADIYDCNGFVDRLRAGEIRKSMDTDQVPADYTQTLTENQLRAVNTGIRLADTLLIVDLVTKAEQVAEDEPRRYKKTAQFVAALDAVDHTKSSTFAPAVRAIAQIGEYVNQCTNHLAAFGPIVDEDLKDNILEFVADHLIDIERFYRKTELSFWLVSEPKGSYLGNLLALQYRLHDVANVLLQEDFMPDDSLVPRSLQILHINSRMIMQNAAIQSSVGDLLKAKNKQQQSDLEKWRQTAHDILHPVCQQTMSILCDNDEVRGRYVTGLTRKEADSQVMYTAVQSLILSAKTFSKLVKKKQNNGYLESVVFCLDLACDILDAAYRNLGSEIKDDKHMTVHNLYADIGGELKRFVTANDDLTDPQKEQLQPVNERVWRGFGELSKIEAHKLCSKTENKDRKQAQSDLREVRDTAAEDEKALKDLLKTEADKAKEESKRQQAIRALEKADEAKKQQRKRRRKKAESTKGKPPTPSQEFSADKETEEERLQKLLTEAEAKRVEIEEKDSKGDTAKMLLDDLATMTSYVDQLNIQSGELVVAREGFVTAAAITFRQLYQHAFFPELLESEHRTRFLASHAIVCQATEKAFSDREHGQEIKDSYFDLLHDFVTAAAKQESQEDLYSVVTSTVTSVFSYFRGGDKKQLFHFYKDVSKFLLKQEPDLSGDYFNQRLDVQLDILGRNVLPLFNQFRKGDKKKTELAMLQLVQDFFTNDATFHALSTEDGKGEFTFHEEQLSTLIKPLEEALERKGGQRRVVEARDYVCKQLSEFKQRHGLEEEKKKEKPQAKPKPKPKQSRVPRAASASKSQSEVVKKVTAGEALTSPASFSPSASEAVTIPEVHAVDDSESRKEARGAVSVAHEESEARRSPPPVTSHACPPPVATLDRGNNSSPPNAPRESNKGTPRVESPSPVRAVVFVQAVEAAAELEERSSGSSTPPGSTGSPDVVASGTPPPVNMMRAADPTANGHLAVVRGQVGYAIGAQPQYPQAQYHPGYYGQPTMNWQQQVAVQPEAEFPEVMRGETKAVFYPYGTSFQGHEVTLNIANVLSRVIADARKVCKDPKIRPDNRASSLPPLDQNNRMVGNDFLGDVPLGYAIEARASVLAFYNKGQGHGR